MSKVLIGFSTGKYSPVSALIRKMTGSKCSHTWLMYYDTFFDRPMIMESQEWGGVRIIDAEEFYKRNQIVAVYVPKIDMTPAIQLSGHLLGQLYDFSGLFGMAIVVLAWRWLHKKVKNPLQSPHGLFCSELVAHTMLQSFYPKFKEDPSTVTPKFLLGFLAKDEGTVCLSSKLTPAQCLSV